MDYEITDGQRIHENVHQTKNSFLLEPLAPPPW